MFKFLYDFMFQYKNWNLQHNKPTSEPRDFISMGHTEENSTDRNFKFTDALPSNEQIKWGTASLAQRNETSNELE
jgi:hypothetical protein